VPLGHKEENMSAPKVFLVGGKRTPFGKFGGSLKEITPVDLAVYAGKACLDSIQVKPEQIDQVIFANVVNSSTDTMYAGRHVALKIGCPITTPGYVVNRLCGSGMQVLLDAGRLIRLGEANAVLACGAENLSMSPHLTYGSRFGTKYGALKSVDMLLDALTDKYCNTPMGITAENLAEKYKVTRAECDQFSLESHQKANKAYSDGLIQDEIIPIELKREVLSRDEHLRSEISLAEMNKLPATFKKDGTVTAGSASGIVDGAAAILVASEEFIIKNKLTPLAELIDGTVVGVEPTIMGIGPVPAISQLLERQKMNLKNIDLFEINEAFAAQTLAVGKALELDMSKLNIWGGATALGHPLGATGLKITLTLARQLKYKNCTWGISSACIGGGQGIALLLKKA
jgi:acetyl-CoA acyltransferase 2